MRILSETTGESCHLSTLRDGRVVILAQSESPKPVRLSVELGGRFLPKRTASGRLLLAHQPGRERARRNASRARIRREGLVLARDESLVGVHDAAVLVGNPEVGVCAALTLTWLAPPGGRGRLKHLVPALRQCAKTINTAAGLRS